jgi:hypothetical protein
MSEKCTDGLALWGLVANVNCLHSLPKECQVPELSVGERLLYTTVKLTSQKNGVTTSTGTGFYFAFCREGDARVLAIVTNKHVVENSDTIVAICHMSENDKPSNELARLNIELGPATLLHHPDPNIDLCIIFMGDILHQVKESGREFFICELNATNIPKAEDWQYFDAMEEVTMLGCPNGLFDEANNLPIARRGIAASLLSKNYNGKPEFMVDMACFPGSSGSPIFIHNRDGYLDRKTNAYMMNLPRTFLIGILYAGPLIMNTGQVILAQPSAVQVSSMMHLGNAIKSTALLDFERLIRENIKP